jgi:hypothetical protein
MSSNQSTFGTVCDTNVLSTVKPLRATRIPGRSTSAKERLP